MSGIDKPDFSHDKSGIQRFRVDFNKGSNILKEAAEEYIQTDEVHKKAQLKKSMNEAFEAMNQIVNDVLHEKGNKLEEKFSKDYKNFLHNANSDTMKDLNDDMEDIEKSL